MRGARLPSAEGRRMPRTGGEPGGRQRPAASGRPQASGLLNRRGSDPMTMVFVGAVVCARKRTRTTPTPGEPIVQNKFGGGNDAAGTPGLDVSAGVEPCNRSGAARFRIHPAAGPAHAAVGRARPGHLSTPKMSDSLPERGMGGQLDTGTIKSGQEAPGGAGLRRCERRKSVESQCQMARDVLDIFTKSGV